MINLDAQNENVAVSLNDEERQQEALDNANIQIETVYDGMDVTFR